MAATHDWHQFDEVYEVRQTTDEGQDNAWEVRRIGAEGPGVVLSDEEFDQLRREGPNPKGLD